MTTWKRVSVSAAAMAALATVLAGCSSMSNNPQAARLPTPNSNVAAVQGSQVATTSLPAIGQGADGQPLQPTQVAPGLTGQPVLGGAQQNTLSVAGGAGIGDPANPAPLQTASANGSFVTLDSVGTVPSAPGRDLSGGLSIEKLLGGWTIVSGQQQCKLNLTYTEKTGTSRYRASTPGCALQGLNVVSSWQLAGTQVQLFDENGDIIAAMILSGNRFIGTLAGGQGISMVG